jgi:hypothetical protein
MPMKKSNLAELVEESRKNLDKAKKLEEMLQKVKCKKKRKPVTVHPSWAETSN